MSDKQNSFASQIAVFTLAAVLLSVGSASAEEYASGAGALEYFDADARAAISPQLRAWLMFMLGTFAVSIFFAWKHPIARWALGGIIVAMAAGHTVFGTLGLPMLGGSIAIWHIVCWTPVLILLLIKRPFLNPEEGRWFRIWSAMLTAVIVISFLFDSVHAATYIRLFSAAAHSLADTQQPDVKTDQEPSFTQGVAQTDITTLYQWTGDNPRTAIVGTIKSPDGTGWTVPAKTHFQSATKAADLYNEANRVEPDGIADVDLEAIPVIDVGGDEIFTAYVFGDNYFEFYVNGKLLAVDAVPMTPFNSSVIRFKTQRPFTVAIMGVDWEERLGLGFEKFRGATFHQGDAGLVAVVKDAAGETVSVTDASWKAQTFYTAPLKTKECLVLNGAIRDSSKCSTEDVADGTAFFAAHWPIPENWASIDFDDSDWPNALTFTNDFVGVDNKPAYTKFIDLFDDPQSDAKFIWSSSLVHDNLVLMRTTVGKQQE